jgi:Cu-Zn family superoxide dismutase
MTAIPKSLLAAALMLPLAAPALADNHEAGHFAADVGGRGDKIDGTVTVEPTPSGVMIVTLDLTGVPPGEHAVHIHETGDCSADDFTSAGGHVAGDAKHGVMVEGGPHPGDLPNAHVRGDGILQIAHFNARLAPEHLTDADGAAFVMHEGADDYMSQPAGAAGARIACGVFEKAGM